MYSLFILPCFAIFFIIYGLCSAKKGKKIYRVGPVFLVFCFSVVVSAFVFSVVNQSLNMGWVKDPKDFFKNQLMFAIAPLVGFALSTIVRGDWKSEEAKQKTKAQNKTTQEQPKKDPMPPSRIALLSGISSSLGYIPHFGFLLAILLLNGSYNLYFLVPTYIASVLLGEWIFWSSVGLESPLKKSLKKAICSDSFYLISIVSEFSFHGLFLYTALKAGWNPLHFYLILLSCKIISGPVQSYLSYFLLSGLRGLKLAAGLQLPCYIIADLLPQSILPITLFSGLLCNATAVARSKRAIEHFYGKNTGELGISELRAKLK
ncbi:MAG: hypothetical protein KDK71_10560, partial [Chlamydiia bacterium]|nr:hypothetical protein [Chlamydiia bacterium]